MGARVTDSGFQPRISLENASASYGRHEVFRNLSLRVDGGEILAVLGPNGRGKTTLIKTVVGSLRLTAGTRSVTGTIGYLPQAAQTTFDFTARDMVMMGRARSIGLFGSPRNADYRAVDAALQRLNLSDLAERPITTLSGGEWQLVAVARALAGDCNILVLDEPASALDLRNQRLLFETLRDLARRNGMAIVFTTHVPGHAFAAADSALLMHGTGELAVGRIEDTLTDAALTRLYGTPVRVIAAGNGAAREAAAIAV